MSDFKSLSQLAQNRKAPEAILAGLIDKNREVSKQAGVELCAQAREYGISVRDYLKLAIDVKQSAQPERYAGLDGLEASFAHLGLPVKNDFANGIVLQAAADTFVS